MKHRRAPDSTRATAWRLAVLSAVALAGVGRPARGGDAFEIQVYDGTANAPGQAGIEAHVNHVVSGHTAAPPPELPSHHQTHLTLEPSYGIRPTWEVGAYFMTALQSDGAFDVVGGKLRSKHVTSRAFDPRARLGVNVEVSYARTTYEPERWTFELRPIAAWEDQHVLVAVNPIVGASLTGGGASFEPAAMALFQVPGLVSFGVEYYADLGGLVHPLPVGAQEHYLYEVVNLLRVPGLELNLGLGEGLTSASSAFVAKMILGYEL